MRLVTRRGTRHIAVDQCRSDCWRWARRAQSMDSSRDSGCYPSSKSMLRSRRAFDATSTKRPPCKFHATAAHSLPRDAVEHDALSVNDALVGSYGFSTVLFQPDVCHWHPTTSAIIFSMDVIMCGRLSALAVAAAVLLNSKVANSTKSLFSPPSHSHFSVLFLNSTTCEELQLSSVTLQKQTFSLRHCIFPSLRSLISRIFSLFFFF